MNSKLIKSVVFVVLLCIASMAKATRPLQHYYQLKIYHLKTKAQEDRLEKYLKEAYVPAWKRVTSGGLIGVFKTLDADTDKRVYVFTIYSKLQVIEKIEADISIDQQYLDAGKGYLDAAYNEQPYTRVETIVLKAFPKWPVSTVPQLTANKADRIYELRSYESPTEKLNINKVKMFNEGGETVLFNRLNFNAVFYAEVLAGSHMPNLMYMTTFNSKEDRDKHWDTFSNDPEWKTLVAKPEYQHNVSKADIIFLHPADYSDF